MEPDRHVAFAAQIRAQLHEIAAIYDRIDERERVPGSAGRESLALQLHNLYSAAERLLEIMAYIEQDRRPSGSSTRRGSSLHRGCGGCAWPEVRTGTWRRRP